MVRILNANFALESLSRVNARANCIKKLSIADWGLKRWNVVRLYLITGKVGCIVSGFNIPAGTKFPYYL